MKKNTAKHFDQTFLKFDAQTFLKFVIPIAILVILAALSTPALANYNFNGFSVTTRTNGTVHGGVFIDYVPGAEDTQTGYFDVPNGNIKWAYLYTGIWGGTEDYEGWVNVTFNGDYTSNNLGPIWIRGKNDTNPNVWGSGHGKHWMYYNVTNLTNAGSTNIATVSKINATDPGGNFDGDPYGIVLVVVYEGGDNPKDLRYWINDGSEGLNYVNSHDYGTTDFDGTVDTNKVNDANLTMVHLTAYDPAVDDGLKFNGNTLDTSMIDTNAFELNSWDVTSYLESLGNDAWYTRCGDYPTCNVLYSDGYINICNAILVLDETPSQPAQPDLNVTAIKVNPDHDAAHRELFANESNTINATITNLDPSNTSDAFNVSFEIEGVNTWEVRVNGLAAGASTDVSINWTPTSGGTLLSPVNYNLNVTADCDGEVSETDETNNASTKTLSVYNNGYKGKRYTGGSDIETEQIETINGSLIYSKGDTAYQSGGTWSSYTVHWTAGNLSVPGSATVRKARLYVYYNWDSSADGINASMDFNGHVFSMDDLDAHYKDTKGYGMYYNHKSGTMVYNVTSDFNTAGNTATLTKVVTNNIVAIYGMLLVVVYEDASEPQRLIWINEECDILDALGEGSSTTGYIGVNETEATAYAPFSGTIDISRVDAATLITVAPAGDSGPGNEDRLYFNNGEWDNVWNGASGEDISICETNVKGLLQSGSNLARMQSRGDYITATNAFLVVKYKDNWYWKDYNGEEEGGYMPDFDQNQDFTGDPAIEQNYCAPTAIANSLWWFDQKYPDRDVVPVGWTPQQLIQQLAWLMDTNGQRTGNIHWGTNVSDEQAGIDEYLAMYGLTDLLYEHTEPKPEFEWIEAEIERSQDVKLDLGFYEVIEVVEEPPGSGHWVITWQRVGGHAVTSAGVNSENFQIAVSDPDADNAEFGLPGVVRGPNHNHGGVPFRDPAYDHTQHNDGVSASHDIYNVNYSISPGGKWELTDDYWKDPQLKYWYEYNNGGQWFNVTYYDGPDPPVVVGEIHTEIEYVVVVSPKITEICGDVNDDGEVDMADVMTLWYYIANYPYPGAYTISNAWAADVNCDGELDMADVMTLWYYIANYPYPGAYVVNCC